jgi:hypothetical protein
MELIVQDSGAAQGVTPDRGIAPGLAAGARDLVGVEAMGDCPRRRAGYELPEYPADNIGLGAIDSPATTDRLEAQLVCRLTSDRNGASIQLGPCRGNHFRSDGGHCSI